MTFKVDHEHVYVTVHTMNLNRIATYGFECLESTAADPHYIELQEPDYIRKLTGKVINQIPGAPPMRSFVFARFTVMSPLFYNLATGVNATHRPNRDIVHAQVEIATLRKRCMTVLVDRNRLSPSVVYSPDTCDLSRIDINFLEARNYASPDRALFDAGILAYGSIPLSCVKALICVDDVARRCVAEAIGTKRTMIVVDSSFFHRNKPPMRDPA